MVARPTGPVPRSATRPAVDAGRAPAAADPPPAADGPIRAGGSPGAPAHRSAVPGAGLGLRAPADWSPLRSTQGAVRARCAPGSRRTERAGHRFLPARGPAHPAGDPRRPRHGHDPDVLTSPHLPHLSHLAHKMAGGEPGRLSAVMQPESRLSRRLGTADAVVVGVGAMVGTGVFVVWAPAADRAGGWLLPGLGIAAFVAFCNATSSAALAAVHPQSGGTYVYGRERLGHGWGALAGYAFVLGKVASCA